MAKNLHPKNFNLSVFGSPISGFAEGTMITVRRNKDASMVKVGADGEAVIIGSADKSGEIEFVLMQTSSSNLVLSNSARLFESSNGALGRGIVQVKDIGGTTVINCQDAAIKKMPDAAFSDDIETRTWVLVCGDLDMLIGGN